MNVTFRFPLEDNYFINEAFNTLSINLRFSGPDRKVITMTSCFENEGKSFTVLQLARHLCQDGKRVLVISGQITANSIADELLSFGVTDTTVATWFAFDKDLARPQDVRLVEEDDLMELVRDGSFDLVVGDERQFAILTDIYDGETYDLPQFALSGRLQEV